MGVEGEKNLFISLVPSFCAPPVPLQSPLSRASLGWTPPLANRCREKLLQISLSCASRLPAPPPVGPPGTAGCCASPCPLISPQKETENSPVALTCVYVTYPCFNDTSLPQKRTGLIWGSCYITAKIQLPLSVSGYPDLHPKSSKEKSMTSLYQLVQNAHLHKIDTKYTSSYTV